MQMSKRDSKRIRISDRGVGWLADDGVGTAVLQMSVRQAQRLLARYEGGGGAALILDLEGARPATA